MSQVACRETGSREHGKGMRHAARDCRSQQLLHRKDRGTGLLLPIPGTGTREQEILIPSLTGVVPLILALASSHISLPFS